MATEKFDASAWFIRLRPDPGAALRFYCFPYAGGSIPVFRNWLYEMPAAVELVIVQLPGRGTRILEKPYISTAEAVPDLVNALLAEVDRPYAFFGHSLGALLCFEAARAMQQLGKPLPRVVFASGRSAPHLPDPNLPIHGLPEPEFIRKIRDFEGTPQEILQNPDLLEIFLPVLRADFQMNETYRYQPGPKLDCDLAAFGGDRDQRVPFSHLQAWSELTNRNFLTRLFPGNHFFLHSAQESLLKTILPALILHSSVV
ncbi:MAG: alpha/beta fold hydrolase [Anaerolineales bacterium]|nr:alpha/beta fold hydrolase [Anaerolineales bacterium]